MNSFVKEFFDIFKGTQSLRDQFLDALSDEDLAFRLPGENPTLGALCREIGEVQQSYLQSFKTFAQDFSYRADDPALETSVERLKTWLQKLDADMNAVIEGMSEAELDRMIDRGGGFMLPARIQPHLYREALLIFFGKASVYAKAMGKPLTQQWREWIA